MKSENKELTVLKGQVSKLENKASTVTIESKEDYAQAVDLVAKLKAFNSELTQKKESITKPLNQALNNARDLFRPIEAQFNEAEGILKGKLLAYHKEAAEKTRAEEAKIAKRLEDGNIKLETAEKKMDAVERVEETTRGKVGEVQIRTIKKVRIVDAALLPREYLVPDMVAIRRDALKGVTIQGAEVYEEETVAAGSF